MSHRFTLSQNFKNTKIFDKVLKNNLIIIKIIKKITKKITNKEIINEKKILESGREEEVGVKYYLSQFFNVEREVDLMLPQS